MNGYFGAYNPALDRCRVGRLPVDTRRPQLPYTITRRITPEGWTQYGFQLPSDHTGPGFRQFPCWDLKKDAVASAIFHLEQRRRDLAA